MSSQLISANGGKSECASRATIRFQIVVFPFCPPEQGIDFVLGDFLRTQPYTQRSFARTRTPTHTVASEKRILVGTVAPTHHSASIRDFSHTLRAPEQTLCAIFTFRLINERTVKGSGIAFAEAEDEQWKKGKTFSKVHRGIECLEFSS